MPTKRKRLSVPNCKATSRPRTAATAPKDLPRPPIGCIDGDALAAEQGVGPIHDFAHFLDEIGDAWPEGESVDAFVAAIRQRRRQGPRSPKT